MHLYVNFQLNVKWAKFISQPTLMLATMLMTIVEHLPGGDRVGENVDEDVDDHCWTFARWGSNACTTCRELAATCRITSRCKNWDDNRHNFVFGDIFGHNFGNWISIVFLKTSKCKTIELLARYVAQQCSQPVSLLGDQKGLRMIKVTYFLGKRKVVKQLLIKS